MFVCVCVCVYVCVCVCVCVMCLSVYNSELAQEEGEGQVEAGEQMKHIQKEFSELFTKWSKLSQLSVGFMMYLDSRIEADSYLIKVNAIHTLSPRSGEEFNFPGNQAPGQWQPL